MIKAMFSPKGGISAEIMRTIGAAKSSVKIAAFSFTTKYIGTVIKNVCKKQRVKVQLIFDADNADTKFSIDEWLSVYGAEVRRLSMTRGVMHNKFIIVDDTKLITGSYNYTNDAENRNYENVIITDIPEIVTAYIGEFNKLWSIGK
jgi:phosphatidylserine/phosphatidylglycerophosphate/cardiolipin synthase-like enzyme